MTIHVSRETESLPLNIQHQIEQKREGRRRHVNHGGLVCSRCLENPPRSKKDRYCAECRKQVMRDHRVARAEELQRLRALAEELAKGKVDGQSSNAQEGPQPAGEEKHQPG